MVASMTGFARETEIVERGELAWEVRSVNHRYLDISLRLPEAFRPVELVFRKILNENFGRGRIDAALHYQETSRLTGGGTLQPERIAALRSWEDSVRRLSPDSAPLTVAEMLNWPGVICADSIDAETLATQAQALLRRAVSSLQNQRCREGEGLASVIAERVTECRRIVHEIQAGLDEIEIGVKQRLQERIADLEVTPDPGRLEQELVLMLGRSDISEELDRLLLHLSETAKVLQRDEPVGRRLDFLMQELNREANTVGSKSAHSSTSTAAVDLKVLIEQIREQVQNIE